MKIRSRSSTTILVLIMLACLFGVQITSSIAADPFLNENIHDKAQSIPSSNTGANSLLIQGSTDRTQFAEVSHGANATVIATTSAGGKGYLYEISPDGTLKTMFYSFFPGDNRLTFTADTVGKHIWLFLLDDNQVSNAIVINVVANHN